MFTTAATSGRTKGSFIIFNLKTAVTKAMLLQRNVAELSDGLGERYQTPRFSLAADGIIDCRFLSETFECEDEQGDNRDL